MVVRIFASARRHGFTDVEILEAVAKPIGFVWTTAHDGDQMLLIVGFVGDKLLEVGMLLDDERDDEDNAVVIHCMKATTRTLADAGLA